MSSLARAHPGLLRRYAPRNDDKRVNKIPYFEVISMGFPPRAGEGPAMTEVEVIGENAVMKQSAGHHCI